MRTVTKTYHVFNFSELEPKVQEKVLEKYKRLEDWCWDSTDSDNLTESLREKAQEGGFQEGVKVLWSLSSCQGDGVAFDGLYEVTDEFVARHGDDLNYDEQRRLHWLIKKFEVNARVRNGGRYTHWNSMTYEIECNYEDCIDYHMRDEKLVIDLLSKLHPLVKREVQDLSRECESTGYDDINYHYTDEYIKEEIEALGTEYLVDGTEFDE
jgi:hypothetical protein